MTNPRRSGDLILFFDTETTSLPLWREPSSDPRQPHLVQIAALLVDFDTRVVVESLDVIVKPAGWIIPEDVVAIHGITTEHALARGIPEPEALDHFMALHELAAERVAHVESFDARIIRIALKRYRGDAAADTWKAAPADCTGKLAKAALGMSKHPKLVDAHRQLTGEDMSGSHSAMADARACMNVFFSPRVFALVDTEAQPAAA